MQFTKAPDHRIDTETKDERKRVLIEQARKLELENNEKEQQLLPAEEVQDAISSMATAFAEGLDSLGPRIASDLVGLDTVAEIQEALFDECRTIRGTVADAVSHIGVNLYSFTNPETPAKKKRKPVGKRKQNTTSRKP